MSKTPMKRHHAGAARRRHVYHHLRRKTMTGATLFTGFGGADLGMKAAGIHVLWGIEYDEEIAAVALANGLRVTVADILTIDPATMPRVDCLHASPPCPSFSTAKTGGQETETDLALARQVAAFITTIQPAVFTLENVWPYRQSESWQIIRRSLDARGYGWNCWYLNAADYGVPQTRQRMIVAARRDGHRPRRPTPTHSENPTSGGLFGHEGKRWIGWYEAIEDLLDTLPESEFAPWQLKRLPGDVQTSLLAMSGNTNLTDERPLLRSTSPANTVSGAGGGRGTPKALLINAAMARKETDYTSIPQERPSMTVTAAVGRRPASTPKALLVDGAEMRGKGIQRDDSQPAHTIKGGTGTSTNMPRALLVDGDNATKQSRIHHGPSTPASTVATNALGRQRALLIPGDSNANTSFSPNHRDADIPAYAVKENALGRQRALIVDCQNDGGVHPVSGERTLTIRDQDEPMFTLSATMYKRTTRAFMPRVVAMTPRALARFQAFPDTYELPPSRRLACKGLGNAVPPPLIQRLYESL